ncbi:hypothetical protein [Streptomyces sp. NPDC048192]|uniref:hypothetical protein n=1 Tax=Streptomyces sp. NPDC048192 TaxID=3365510 RepID=UPI003719F80C
MTRTATRSGAGDCAGAVELAALVNWMSNARGRVSYGQLAEAATAAGHPVTAKTLRRAVDGRVPTSQAVTAWAVGAGADPRPGEALLRRVRAARNPLARMQYDASRITKRAGVVRAMKVVLARAGLTLRELETAPEAGYRLRRSTVSAVLRGERPVTAELLTAFLEVCHVTGGEARLLMAARDRAEDPRSGRCGESSYPCAVAERAEDQRTYQRDRRRYRGLPNDEDEEEDGYQAMLREQREEDLLSDEELEAMQAEAAQAPPPDISPDELRRMIVRCLREDRDRSPES